MMRKNQQSKYLLFLTKNRSSRVFYAGILFFVCYVSGLCFAGHTNNIMLTGYWPPTNEMLRKFSTDPNLNPGGWQGQNWEGRGYNIYAYFPEFPGGTGSNPKGNGNFEIDYQDVGSWSPPAAPTGDFWCITGTVHPVAIMSFGQGAGPWEIEFNARNLPSSTWTNDYLSPLKPTPAPPDTTQPSGYVRHSSLPVEAIAEAVNGSGLGINAWVDWDVDPGHFLCEYMAYHDGWYQNLHSDPCDQYYCVAAGFTHIAAGVSPSNGTIGVEAALRALIKNLDSQLIQYTISGTVTTSGSPLAGVTMCGLPGNPVTNSSGVYTAQVGGGWSGTVTPLKSGYAFIQKTYSNVIANQSAQDYTASAATADTITFDAASNAGSSTASTTLSWSHTIGSGNNRVLIVGIVTEDSTAADQIINSVKFNGVNMTPISGSTKSRTVYSGSSYSSSLRTDLYYMLNPPVGTYTVLVTCNGSVSYRVGGAISLKNVKQQVPEAVIASSATSASISTSINVPNAGAWVVDVVGHSNSGSFTSSTTTERWDKNSGYNTSAGGTKVVTTPGLNTITWTFSGSSGSMVHSLAAFAPSETIPVEQRSLTTSASSGGTVTTPGIGTYWYTYGTNANIVASANPNYHFVNWTGTAVTAGKVANPTSPTTTVLMDANYTVQANFALDQKSLTTSASSGGTVTTPGIGTYWYDYNTPASIVASANANYHFVNWTGTAVTAGKVANPNAANTTVTMDANYTVQANFAIDQKSLLTSASSGGTVTTPGIGTYLYDFNSSASIVASANANYHFVNWTGTAVTAGKVANPNAANTTVTMDANYTVQANFAIDQKSLTTSASSGGTVTTPGIGTYLYDFNSSASIVASANANYHFVNWTGSAVTAGKVSNPNSSSTTVLMDANYAVQSNFAIDQKTISGYVTEPDANISVTSVSINATNGGDSDTTDVNGYYHLTVNYGWSGTVTPSKTGYTFEPNSIVYNNVTTDQPNDYTAILDTFIISGYAVDSTLAPLAGVLAAPDNNGGSYTSKYYGGGSDITDVNGYYEVLVDYNWSGKVAPSKYAYAFEPNNATYSNVTANIAEQNYVGTLLTYKITGYIKNWCEVPIKNVNVDANNGGGSDTTDVNGYYEVWVGYNWSGTVTPSKAHYTFDPNSRAYTNVLENKTAQDYTANNIYDLDCSGYIGFGDVRIISDNWLDPGLGDFNGDGTVNFLDFADFAQVWLEE